MKRAQIEIAGLMIIVVLVSIVILFVLSFNVGEKVKDEPKRQELRDSQMRDRFGPVILETTAGCNEWTIRELLSDCAYNQEIYCQGTISSCEFANDTIKKVLKETYDKIGHSFTLEVKSSNNVVTLFNYTGCDPGVSNSDKGLTHFQTDFGPMTMILTQCT